MFRRRHNTSEKSELDAAFQEEKVSELRAALGSLSRRSSQFCTDACLRRYLRARNWNIDKSKKMLEDTLKWRSNYKPEEIRWPEVAQEGETGKAYRANFQDKDGRTVIVMTPAKQNTTSHDKQLQHLVYLLENAISNLPEEQEQMVWLIDFNGWSLSNSTPIKTAREATNILQNHYPERLATAFLYNPPRIFETFWKIVKYFLDPMTFQKVKFIYPKNEETVDLIQRNFDVEVLPKEFGGKNDMQYNHEEFSRLMEKDDTKMAGFWGLNEKSKQVANGHLTSEITPEAEPSPPLAAHAS
ncbi:phosphatidylinositol transfer protein 3-like isoform X2 [Dioscorea cayenensis subsp. rotundata]|uniref:Phosphatidylinositol transfer protein 3-like isoform X2 n=1 Tax=Dioscorea cayennensis subsp. rotundata TaxID=55577 RepID=A0AB40CJM1_DIOCR|nr:phosphatidylinositol transfer protein 3-like isoform X2 [Dioscorea cayenensis subsp. rotundata]